MDRRTTACGLVAFALTGCLPELRIIPCRDGSTCRVRDRPTINDLVHDEVESESESDTGTDAQTVDVHDGASDATVDATDGCASDRAECSRTCVLLRSDPRHCGQCDRACEVDQQCALGECIFPQRSCPDASEPGCGMRAVPGGTFTMGDDTIEQARPARTRLVVGPFAMDQYEVSVARFRRYLNAGMAGVFGSFVNYPGGMLPWNGPAMAPNDTLNDANCNWSAAPGVREQHPINCIDWFTAQAFCVWDGGHMPADSLTGRLPTEAEWEFAARSTDDRPYPWGNNPPETRGCWERPFDNPPATCTVDDARFTSGVSPFGVWQLSGNVAEWAADNYAAYNSSYWSMILFMPRHPLCRLDVNADRTVRGSIFQAGLPPESHRAAGRVGYASVARFEILGFRCVRTR